MLDRLRNKLAQARRGESDAGTSENATDVSEVREERRKEIVLR